MEKIDFKKIWNNIKGKKECVKETGSNPIRDWRIIIAIFFPLVFVFGFLSWWCYSTLNAEEFMAVLPNTPVRFATIDKPNLKSEVEFFEGKKAKLEILKVAPPSILIDPSL